MKSFIKKKKNFFFFFFWYYRDTFQSVHWKYWGSILSPDLKTESDRFFSFFFFSFQPLYFVVRLIQFLLPSQKFSGWVVFVKKKQKTLRAGGKSCRERKQQQQRRRRRRRKRRWWVRWACSIVPQAGNRALLTLRVSYWSINSEELCVRERERERERERGRWRSVTPPNKEKTETCTNDESLISGQERTFSFHPSLCFFFSSLPRSISVFNICFQASPLLPLLSSNLFLSITSFLFFSLSLPPKSHLLSNVNFSIHSLSLSISHFFPPLHIFCFTFNHCCFFFPPSWHFPSPSCIRTRVSVDACLPTGASRAWSCRVLPSLSARPDVFSLCAVCRQSGAVVTCDFCGKLFSFLQGD